MEIREIKQIGKAAFLANYWRCVAVAFLMGILTTGSAGTARSNIQNSLGSSPQQQQIADFIGGLSPSQQIQLISLVLGTVSVIAVIGILLRIFLLNPLETGGYRFFKKNITEPSVGIGTVAEGFGGYGHTFLTLLLRDVFILLWSLLFVIPGLIKIYSYRLVPYLIKDYPELSATETITLSRSLMNGHKMEAFILDLSFIGWYLLGAITFGLVNIFWADPYHYSASAAFYLRLREQDSVFSGWQP